MSQKQEYLHSLLIFTLLAAGNLHAQLPPEVQADRLLLRAQAEMEREEWKEAAATFDDIVKLGVERPMEFDYYHARALAKAERVLAAHEAVTRFLSTISRDHELYTPALEIMNDVEPKVAQARAEAEAQKRLAEWKEEKVATFTWNAADGKRIPICLVTIQPGTFKMGGNGFDERPVLDVTIGMHYWLGETEVTQELYEAVMGKNPSSFKGPKRPVENVSWEDAMAFCERLNAGYAHLLPSDYKFTLPTEAQWEYACRAGTTGDYAGDLDAMAWYDKTTGEPQYKKRFFGKQEFTGYSGGSTRDVATKQPNAWGLYDMHGNVWEWCRDWYKSDYSGYPSGAQVTNPIGPSSGSDRVYRGGSWHLRASYARSAYRNDGSPGDGHYAVGFRLALSSVQ